jgi:hypothetical protein
MKSLPFVLVESHIFPLNAVVRWLQRHIQRFVAKKMHAKTPFL